ncbi:MAG: transporter substrate-binding domain-containing protein [Gordonibacter sp.]|nr:transporter substrate-binding domain-containing protein [Gordonibacter sp.]
MLSCLLISGSNAYAGPDEGTKTVRVGYFLREGYQEQNDDGSYSGYGYDYLQKIARSEGFTYEYVPGTWHECLDRLERGEIDIMGFMPPSDAYRELFEYPQWNCGYDTVVLFTAKDGDRFAQDAWSDYDGMSVGILRGSSVDERLETFAQTHGFTYKPIIFDTQEALESALQDGTVDAGCTNTMVVPTWARVLSNFDPQPLYYAVKQGDTELLSQLNDALGTIKTTEPEFEQGLRSQYYADDSQTTVVFSESEKEYLQHAAPVSVAMENGIMPLESFDDKGKPQGVSSAVLDKVSAMTGLQFEYVKTSSYGESVSLVKQKQVDMMCGYNEDTEMLNGFETSSAYLTSSIVLMGRSDVSFANRDNLSIALLPRIRYLAPVLSQDYAGCRFVEYDTSQQMFDAVSSGTVDMLAINLYSAQSYLAAGYSNLGVVGDTGRVVQFRMVYQSGATPELTSIVNKCIASLSDADKNAMLLNSGFEEVERGKI